MFAAPRIEYGERALETLKGEECSRALVITDKNLSKLEFPEFVIQNLKAERVEVYDGVEGEPDTTMAFKCSEFARKVDPELIVAIGGGSVIDLAKFARVAMEVNIDPREVRAKLNLRAMGFRKKAKLVAVPTTSGSGADCTLAVMLKHGNSKISAINVEFIPDMTILDYRLVEKMPRRLVATTGVDALAHGIEAFLTKLHNDFSDLFALRAVQLILENIEKSYDGDTAARAKMHLAATMAGIAINNSQLGAVHALAHSFGAVFGLDHSMTIAIFLPKVLRAYIPEQRLEELAEKLGFSKPSHFVKRIEELIENLSLPSKVIETVEDPSGKLEVLIESAMKDLSFRFTPKLLSREEVADIFRNVF